MDGVPTPGVEFRKPPHAISYRSLLGDVGLLTTGNWVEKGSPRSGSLVRMRPVGAVLHLCLSGRSGMCRGLE